MYKVLPPGVKSSITRSISKVYESYMADIEWDEDRYELNDFIKAWKDYIETSTTWNEKVPLEVKESPLFHEEVALKMNQTIEKILSEPPTEEQISRIEEKQEAMKTNFDYACRAEAAFVESKLARLN